MTQINQQSINHNLKNFILDQSESQAWPADLTQAILYSTNAGKRLRPLLVYNTAQSLNLNLNSNNNLNYIAISIELIHCYSLVHDDLPAMDDDDLRRGQPTCHKKFNEATAILVGDALQSLAFEAVSLIKLENNNNLNLNYIIKNLAQSIGPAGMVGGQFLDLAAENSNNIELSQLIKIHNLKTGKLLQACCVLPYYLLSSQAQNPELLNNLTEFGKNLGLAFQIQDDILEATQSTEKLGKSNNSDLTNNKSTFVSILGLEPAKKYYQDILKQAYSNIDNFEKFDHKYKPEYLNNWLNNMNNRQF